ncbi:MAG: DNA repair protein RadC [Lachnospiraceae bacterium]|nr:DNA repair protein RadC [Lachnospiraceae bacterium]
MKNLIKDLADCEKPYEKALMYGVESLSDAELFAIILKSGTKDISSIDLANKIFNIHPLYKGLVSLKYLHREDLTKIKGIGDIKATIILSLAELSHRLSTKILYDNLQFNSPDSIAKYYIEKCKYLRNECTYLMLFSTAHILIKEILLSKGTVNQALISPREIFIEALRYEAVYIVLVHNHPSGVPEPSLCDIEVTKKIKEAGKLIDINLSDHIIVGNNRYVSMLERGMI